MQVTVEEVAMLIGQQRIEIFSLQKENAELRKRLSEAEAKLGEQEANTQP